MYCQTITSDCGFPKGTQFLLETWEDDGIVTGKTLLSGEFIQCHNSAFIIIRY